MAEEEVKNLPEHDAPKVAKEEASATAEVKDRGLFGFLGKKEEEKPQETIATEFEHKVQVSEPVLEKKHEEEEKKPGLLEKLHRSSSSSSSSGEEQGERGEKRKKKKEKKKKKEGEEKTEEEKKGFIEKIKEKLPGHSKKPEEAPSSAPPETIPPAAETTEHPAEKKGILEKIKEKLPGYHSKSGEEKKEKEHD